MGSREAFYGEGSLIIDQKVFHVLEKTEDLQEKQVWGKGLPLEIICTICHYRLKGGASTSSLLGLIFLCAVCVCLGVTAII